jgi:hypothetical protein
MVLMLGIVCGLAVVAAFIVKAVWSCDTYLPDLEDVFQ